MLSTRRGKMAPPVSKPNTTRRRIHTRGAVAACAIGALFAGGAKAAENQDVHAQLSWSAITTSTNLTSPGASNSLYIRLLDNVTSFKGAEFDLRWDPPGDPDAGCIAHISTTYKTSGGTTCTYLNRGTAVPVVTDDVPGHLHVAWANTSALTGCTAGAIIQIGFEFDGCEDATAKLQLCSLKILDKDNEQEVIPPENMGTAVTVLGGGSYAPACNSAPVLNSVLNQTVLSGDSLSFTVSASDADGDTLTFRLVAETIGATLVAQDPTTALFGWRPAVDNSQIGTYTDTVWVSDGRDSSWLAFNVTVTKRNNPPVLEWIPDQIITESLLLDVPLVVSDPDGDIVNLTLPTDYPPGVGLSKIGGQWHLRWTPNYAAAQTNGGVYPGVTVNATDTFDATASQSFTITVRDTNLVPTFATDLAQATAAEGSTLILVTRATDVDLDSLTSDLTVAGGTPEGVSLHSAYTRATGTIADTLIWTIGGQQAGVYSPFTISVTDSGGHTVTDTFTVVVQDVTSPVLSPIEDQSIAEGTLLSVTPVATDADGDSLAWSGANLPPGATVAATAGTLTWTPDYGQAGSYANVRLRASDGTNADSVAFAIVVANTNRAPAIATIPAQTVSEASLLFVTPIGNDPDGDPLVWSGDGPTGFEVDATTGTWTWTPDYDAAEANGGMYTGDVNASDGSLSATQSFAITVLNTDRAPAFTSFPNDSLVTIGQTAQFTVTASDPDNGALTYDVASDLPSWGTFDVVTHVLTLSPADWEPPRTIVLQVSDGVLSATDSLTVTINRPPALDITPAEYNAMEGVPLTVTPAASDADGDALTFAGASLPDGATVDAATGVFEWTPGFMAAQTNGGSYTIAVTVTDGRGGSAATSFTVHVTDTNGAPEITNLPEQVRMTEGTSETLTIDVSDPDSTDVVVVNLVSAPPWITFDAGTRTLTIAPTDADGGTTGVAVFAIDDGQGHTVWDTLSVYVNRAPAPAAIPAQSVAEGAVLTVDVAAADADGDSLTYRIESAPNGAAIDSMTGVFTWTPDYGAAEANGGSYDAAVGVTDGLASASTSFGITVVNTNRDPVVAAVADQTIAENTLLTVAPSATDPDGDTLAWSGAQLPGGAAVDAVTGVFAWTPTFAQAGIYAGVTLSASDGNGGEDSTSFAITVMDVNRAPEIASLPDQTVAESEQLDVPLAGSDADGDSLAFSLTQIAPSPPSGVLPSVTNGAATSATLVWTPTYADAGDYALTVQVADGRSGTASTELHVTVTNVPRAPVLTQQADTAVTEGRTSTIVFHASDPEGGALSWELAGAPGWAELDVAVGETASLLLRPGYTAAESEGDAGIGRERMTVHVRNASALADSTTFIVAIANTNRTPHVDSIAPMTIAEGQLLTFTATGGDPDTLDAVRWSTSGDAEGATIDPTSGVFAWTPGYGAYRADGGPYVQSVTATDLFGANATVSLAITVTNTNRAPIVEAIPDQTVSENETLTVTPSASDPDGDALAWSGTNLPAGANVNATTGALTWTPGYTQEGTYPNVTLTVDDGNGGITSRSFQITVANVNAPPMVASIANQIVAENTLLTVTPSASDPDGDALTWSGSNLPTGASMNASTGVFTWTPDFAQAGSYSAVTLTADDGNGGTASQAFDITVTDVNRPPAIASIPPQTVAENVLLVVTPSAVDPDGDVLTWTATNIPSGASVNAATGAFTWTPGYAQAGVFRDVTLTASDGDASASAPFDITVTNANRPPVVDSIAQAIVSEESTLVVTPSAFDPDGDPLAWSSASLPEGASLDAATGALTWTPDTHAYEGAPDGVYDAIELAVTDGQGDTVTIPLVIRVTDLPPVIAPQSVHACTGETSTQTLQASDEDGAISWSATDLPAWVALTADGVLTLMPPEEAFGLTFAVTVTVTDVGSGLTDSDTLSIFVDCTPASALAVRNTSQSLNRHARGGEPYRVTFEILGAARATVLHATDVALERDGARIVADDSYGVQIDGDIATVGFSRAALAVFLADVPSGEEARVNLHVRAGASELVAPVAIAVTGIARDAALRAAPTPFTRETSVEYVVPEDAPIDVAVFSADGRRVRTLARGLRHAGVYSVRWDGTNDVGLRPARGVYYVRGVVGSVTLMMRVVCMR
jgi:hypothetical protein